MPVQTIELPIDVTAARPILDEIANKWSVLILTVLCTRPARFNDLKRRLDGITHKALSDALKRLERSGLVDRRVLQTQPIGVEYSITALGASLREPFAALYDWSLVKGTELQRAQELYDETRDHEIVERVD